MSNSASKSILLSFYTFLSRVLGLLRDHYMATNFGTGWIASAFSVAYRLPNMFRNLLAEGTLSQSFMPLYSDSRKISQEEAKVMSGAVVSFLFFLLSAFVATFLLIAPYWIPSFVGNTAEYSSLVVRLASILFFLIMTASLAAIFMAISNSRDRFFVPSLSPIVLNLTYLFVLIIVFRFVEGLEQRIVVLSIGIVCGGVLQLVLQGGYVYRQGVFPKFNLNWRHPAIKKIGSLMLPAVLGGGFYQISLLVDIFLANYIQNQNPNLGAVVSLDYSQRLVQFPTGIIGVALATTTLPTLLASLRKNEKASIPQEISNVLSFSLFLTLPSAVGFAILGKPIIDSIFYGGKWDHKATETTFAALRFYSLAIPVYSMNKVLISSYYAFQDTKHPLRINAIAFAVNLCINLLLLHSMKHVGLAIASATSACITFCLLLIGLKRHDIAIHYQAFAKRVGKTIIPVLCLGVWAKVFTLLFYQDTLQRLYQLGISHANASRLTLAIVLLPSMLIYFFIAYLLKSEEFGVIFRRFVRKKS
ncbi:MAG: murein biosynthesis integral membrane protein MurJ [Spirochaetota bacterium]